MYRRYSQAGEGTLTHAQINRNRFKNGIILVLLLAIVALCVVGIPALRNQGEGRTVFIQRIQSECEEAIRQTATLSRNAGADSAAILAKVRSNVASIRTVNTLSNATGNGLLIPETSLTNLLDYIDRYLSFLTTGMDTGEYQTTLQTSLTALQEELAALN